MSIEGILRSVRSFRISHVIDDWNDTLHRVITTNALVAFATLSAYKSFSSSVIECLPPSNFPRSWTR
ncbi:hypothetical protein PFISCL1PPCAC_3874, partial [Pristionchus fissidentatus]